MIQSLALCHPPSEIGSQVLILLGFNWENIEFIQFPMMWAICNVLEEGGVQY